jgi:hypothetical protein
MFVVQIDVIRCSSLFIQDPLDRQYIYPSCYRTIYLCNTIATIQLNDHHHFAAQKFTVKAARLPGSDAILFAAMISQQSHNVMLSMPLGRLVW